MSNQFVKIINRNSYTSLARAEHFINRHMADVARLCPSTKRILEIRMLDESELAIVRRQLRVVNRDEDRDITGSFRWRVGYSGPYRTFKAIHEGI